MGCDAEREKKSVTVRLWTRIWDGPGSISACLLFNWKVEILVVFMGVADPRDSTKAARLLGLRVRFPPGAWIFVSCECCVLSGRGLCDGLIARTEESCRVLCG